MNSIDSPRMVAGTAASPNIHRQAPAPGEGVIHEI